jgi:hypothetical protein
MGLKPIAMKKADALVDSPDFAALATLSAQAQRGVIISIFFALFPPQAKRGQTSETMSGESMGEHFSNKICVAK